jgi:hypothetical protein
MDIWLAMLLSDADYLARAGVAIDVPVHPGPPRPPVGAAAVIAVAIRTYTDALADVACYALQQSSTRCLNRSDPHHCHVTFDAKSVTVHLSDNLLLSGVCTPTTGL